MPPGRGHGDRGDPMVAGEAVEYGAIGGEASPRAGETARPLERLVRSGGGDEGRPATEREAGTTGELAARLPTSRSTVSRAWRTTSPTPLSSTKRSRLGRA